MRKQKHRKVRKRKYNAYIAFFLCSIRFKNIREQVEERGVWAYGLVDVWRQGCITLAQTLHCIFRSHVETTHKVKYTRVQKSACDLEKECKHTFETKFKNNTMTILCFINLIFSQNFLENNSKSQGTITHKLFFLLRSEVMKLFIRTIIMISFVLHVLQNT